MSHKKPHNSEDPVPSSTLRILRYQKQACIPPLPFGTPRQRPPEDSERRCAGKYIHIPPVFFLQKLRNRCVLPEYAHIRRIDAIVVVQRIAGLSVWTVKAVPQSSGIQAGVKGAASADTFLLSGGTAGHAAAGIGCRGEVQYAGFLSLPHIGLCCFQCSFSADDNFGGGAI